MATIVTLLVMSLVSPGLSHADQTYAETTGGVANTWTNYTNAGGTAGPQIGSNQTVQIACKVTGFRVADGNTYWYRIAQSPWNNQFYVSADAFYNNGATSGSLHGTPFVDPAVPDCSSLPSGNNETTGGVANTWTDYTSAGGTAGPQIGANQTVVIACKLTGFKVADGNTYWYRIASAPWSGNYYVSADAFYNNGATSGSLVGTPFVDPAVPDCGPGQTPPPAANKPSPRHATYPVVVRSDGVRWIWYVRESQTGGGATIAPFAYGRVDTGDIPVVGDWDGNGTVTPGVVRKDTTNWRFLLRNSNTPGNADINFLYGRSAVDTPVVGDWDGNGTFTPGVVRKASTNWQYLLRNSNSGGGADLGYLYGRQSIDVPLVGDWDGNGTFTPGVARKSGNNWQYLLRNSNNGGGADVGLLYGNGVTDIPVVGDWDGNGTFTPGVIRSSGNNWQYLLRNTNTGGGANVNFSYGSRFVDQPVVGSTPSVGALEMYPRTLPSPIGRRVAYYSGLGTAGAQLARDKGAARVLTYDSGPFDGQWRPEKECLPDARSVNFGNQDINRLAGWSAGRLGPIYALKYLKDRNDTKSASRINYVVLFDPGGSGSFGKCDNHHPDVQADATLAWWLGLSNDNRLIVMAGSPTLNDSEPLRSSYFPAIVQGGFRNRVLVCGYDMGHEDIYNAYAYVMTSVERLPTTPSLSSCPRDKGAPIQAWNPA